MTSLRILIADDHQLIRRAVRNLLSERQDWCVVETVDGAKALSTASELQPDIAILDISMPEMDGTTVIENLRSVSPGTKVIVLTMWDSEEVFLRAMGAGARGFLLKSAPDIDLVSAVEAVQAGRFFFTMSIANKIVASFLEKSAALPPGAQTRDGLTAREMQVIRLVTEGLTSKEIAARLRISQRTAEAHRNNINHKLNVKSTAQLVRYAFTSGLIRPTAKH